MRPNNNGVMRARDGKRLMVNTEGEFMKRVGCLLGYRPLVKNEGFKASGPFSRGRNGGGGQ